MEYLLGIDIGTSGTKTVLFDRDANPITAKTFEYPLYQEQNGWAEQEPNDWWDATVKGVQGVLEASGVNPADIKGIVLSGQMHGLVMLDEAGEVLRRSIIWCDQRTGAECAEIESLMGGRERLIEITVDGKITGERATKENENVFSFATRESIARNLGGNSLANSIKIYPISFETLIPSSICWVVLFF